MPKIALFFSCATYKKIREQITRAIRNVCVCVCVCVFKSVRLSVRVEKSERIFTFSPIETEILFLSFWFLLGSSSGFGSFREICDSLLLSPATRELAPLNGDRMKGGRNNLGQLDLLAQVDQTNFKHNTPIAFCHLLPFPIAAA